MRLVAAAGVLVLLAACGSSSKPLSTTTTGPTAPTGPPPTATTPLATAPTTAPATSAPPPGGSVTLVVRSPLPFTGTVQTPVICTTERGHYAAEASGFVVGQDTVSMSVNISGYGSPSTYSTPVTVEFLAPDGTSDKVTQTIAVKIADGEHGQFTVNGTDDLGKKVDADFNWSCG